jgi:hypothetical protein
MALWHLRVVGIFLAVIWTIWSGVRPSSGDSKAWYDRAIRAIGGVIILLVLLRGLYLNVKGQ